MNHFLNNDTIAIELVRCNSNLSELKNTMGTYSIENWSFNTSPITPTHPQNLKNPGLYPG